LLTKGYDFRNYSEHAPVRSGAVVPAGILLIILAAVFSAYRLWNPAPVVSIPVASSRGGLSPEEWVSRSLVLCNAKQFAACADAAREAIRLNPALPPAWNNLAIGYAGLERWDDAIQAIHEALRLQPDFGLAQNNLQWFLAEKARAASH
jgi:tetratricopeptide (TPR) repeat protein